MAWEEGRSSFQFGFSSKSENAARQQPRDPRRPAQAVKTAQWDWGFGNGEYGAETDQNNAHCGELHVGAFLVNTAPRRRPHGKLPRPGACRYIIPCTDKLPACHRHTPVLQAKRRKADEVVEAGTPNTPGSVFKLPCCTLPRQEDGSEEEPLSGLYSDLASDVSGSATTLFLYRYVYVCICFE